MTQDSRLTTIFEEVGGGQIPVLCYHRICPKNERGMDSPSLCVTPKQFERQMTLLKMLNYNVISVQEMIAYFQGRKNVGKHPVVLTFDDGYEDNYIYTFPILKKFSYPAVIFLVTDRIGKKNVWDSGNLSLLNESQIEEMMLNGIVFGSHTATHIDMSREDFNKIKDELQRSKKKLELITVRTDIPFCYPYARFNEQAKKLVEECDYCCAFAGDVISCEQGEDFYELRRIQVFPSTSLFGFWKKIQPWYPRFQKFQKKIKG